MASRLACHFRLSIKSFSRPEEGENHLKRRSFSPSSKPPTPFLGWQQLEFRVFQQTEMASRLAGSSDIFGYHNRNLWTSINFITAHDGFCLYDLVSFEQKHNESN
ncbi:MAG: hypothetical protein J6R82_00645, partial [Clostridia bacterium]|nr:hypothetical protein [Clostridia bacterium]